MWSLKVRFSSSVTPRNLIVETFVRSESRIVMLSNVSFWFEININEVLLTLRDSLLALRQLSTPTSSLFTVAWTFLMSLTDGKSTAKCTKRIQFEDLCMSLMYKIKSTGPNTEPNGALRNTRCNVWHRNCNFWLGRLVFYYSNKRLKHNKDAPMQRLLVVGASFPPTQICSEWERLHYVVGGSFFIM